MTVTLEGIKKDYESLMDIIGGVTTIEGLRRLANKEAFGYISVDGNKFFDTDDMLTENSETNEIAEYILYGWYGCLESICVCINNGKIEAVYFDIWTDEYHLTSNMQVSIDEVTEEKFESWMEDYEDFLVYCEREEKEMDEAEYH